MHAYTDLLVRSHAPRSTQSCRNEAGEKHWGGKASQRIPFFAHIIHSDALDGWMDGWKEDVVG
jgi:hypothetical protein